MSLYVPTKKFVSFDVAGEITSISNSPPADNNYIEVEYEQVAKLLSGEESTTVYEITFDTLSKKYQLTKKALENAKIYNVNDIIFEVSNSEDPDLTVLQSNNNERWEFHVTESLAQALLEKSLYNDTILFFSITDADNPFLVHQFITLDLFKLLENRVVYEHFNNNITKNKKYSIYTKKMFENYTYEVINE